MTAAVMPESAITEQAMQLLNFTDKLDITLLDSVVHCFYYTMGPEV